jgi:cellulose biosynthesis protein BcsQ
MAIDYDALSRVICVANGKGGVNKTSIVANVGGLAAAGGYRTLLVDLDPQGDLSDDLGFYANPADDHGQQLAAAILTGGALTATLTDVRPGLDVVTGGEHLTDVVGGLVARASRGASTTNLLAASLAPLAADYDLVLIDTPPVDVTLQAMALGAARWLVVPTRADASSIRGIRRIAERLGDTRAADHPIDLLGVVLTGVPVAARRVRADASRDIQAMLGTAAPLFAATIRSSDAVARTTRDEGILVHELAERAEGAEPFWQALRNGGTPQRVPGSAPALADDYVKLTEEVLKRLAELEAREGVA